MGSNHPSYTSLTLNEPGPGGEDFREGGDLTHILGLLGTCLKRDWSKLMCGAGVFMGFKICTLYTTLYNPIIHFIFHVIVPFDSPLLG